MLGKHLSTTQNTSTQKNCSNYLPDDLNRFNALSFQFEDILLDLSKNRLTTETLDLLFDLTIERNVENMRSDMFDGKEINFTEKRAVLHTALRDQSNKTILVSGQNIIPEIQRVLQQMQHFSEEIICGTISSSNKEQFTDVVNIGIGGSDLGAKYGRQSTYCHTMSDLKYILYQMWMEHTYLTP